MLLDDTTRCCAAARVMLLLFVLRLSAGRRRPLREARREWQDEAHDEG